MNLRMRHIVVMGCVALIVGTVVAAYFMHGDPWYQQDFKRAMELLTEDPQAAMELFEKVAACDKPVRERALAHYYLGRYARTRDLPKAVQHLSVAWNELEPGEDRAVCGIVLSALLYQDGRISELKKVLNSLTKTTQFQKFANDERNRPSRLAAGSARLFFKENSGYGIGETHFTNDDYSRQDFAFWKSLILLRKIGERIGSRCDKQDEIVARIADFVALNVPDRPGEPLRGFANSPGRSLILGYGSATERAWTMCSLLQTMWIKTRIAQPAPDSAPVVIVAIGEKRWIYDCATMREMRDEDGEIVSFAAYLKKHPPVNLIDFSADDGASYFVFADPQQVSMRALVFQNGILKEFATRPTAPVAVNLIDEMFREGQLLSGRKKDAHAPPWPVPFDFRIDAKFRKLAKALKNDPARLEKFPKEDRKRAAADLRRAGVMLQYLKAQKALLEKLMEPRTLMLQGDFEGALVLLDKIATAAGDNAELQREVRYFECLCLYEKGDFAAAKKKLQAFLNVNPGWRTSSAQHLLSLADKQ